MILKINWGLWLAASGLALGAGCAAALPRPTAETVAHTEAQWEKFLDEMADEAKLTPDERALVERFVLSVRTRVD